MKTPNPHLPARRIAVTAAAVFTLSALVACGQPAQEAAAPEPETATTSAPVSTPASAVETPAAQTLSPEQAAEKATLLDAISVAETTVESAEQSQADRQAVLDAAAEQTDAQLQRAAEAAESADTP